MHNMCLVRPAVLYFNVHVLKVFYEQINYYYYYYYCMTMLACCLLLKCGDIVCRSAD